MVHFALQAIQSLCTIIYPKDPAALAFKCSKRMENGATKSDDSKLCENAKVVAMNLPPRSLQRRALLCLVASAYNSDILKTEFALGKQLIAESRKGFNFMANGNVLEKQIPRRLDLPPETEIYYCVFVLGAQIFKSRTKEIPFPKTIVTKVCRCIVTIHHIFYNVKQLSRGDESGKEKAECSKC